MPNTALLSTTTTSCSPYLPRTANLGYAHSLSLNLRPPSRDTYNHTAGMAFTTILAYIFVGAPIAVFLTTQAAYLVASATKIQAIDFYARCAASFTALFVCATYGTLASACLNVVGYGGLGQWTTARAFKWTMLLFTGVWFEIEDPEGCLQGEEWEKLRPAVLLGNHQTELDVLFLGHLFPKYTSVTAKKSLIYVPVLGWFSKFAPIQVLWSVHVREFGH